ncbi:chaplin family protein [Streptomyces sp. NPDC057307]|uniref:chaplin family protein n=1 Tax=Streptomyces sp. NPDC057307 TaxID=3346096 RepID=UPI0036435C05
MRELIGKGLLTAAAASSVLTMTSGYAQATGGAATAAGSPGLLSGNSVQAPVEVPVNVCGNTVNPVGVGNPTMGNSCGNSSGAHAAPPRHRPAHHAPPVAPRAEPATHVVPAQAPPAGPSRTGHDNDNDNDASSTHGAANPREQGGGSAPAKGGHHADHADDGGSSASGAATNSPGLLGGNLVQAPLDIPLNACGNSVDLVGLLNPAFGNGCANDSDDATPEAPVPPGPHAPVDPPAPSTPPVDRTIEPPAVPVAHDPMLPEPPQAVEEGDVIDQLAETGSDANLLAAAAMSAGLLISGGILYRRSHAAARR